MTTFSVKITCSDGGIVSYRFAFADMLMPRILLWETCMDIDFVEVMDETTGEIMYHTNERAAPYVSSDWEALYREELDSLLFG